MDDTISRKMAIDAAHKNYDTILDFKSDGRTVADSFEDIINALPSAQPGLEEWCTDCSEYDKDRHCCPRYNRVIRKAMQPETAKRIVGKSSRGVTMWYQCDICKEPVDKEDNFCPGCGRRLLDE